MSDINLLLLDYGKNKMKRLKIVEQIIIVLVLAVLIPFTTIGVIISNISQHSLRSELAHSASLMAEFLGDTIENYVKYSQLQLNQIAAGISYIPNAINQLKFLDEIEGKTKIFKNLDIVEAQDVPKERYKVSNGRVTMYSPIDKNNILYLKADITIDILDILLGVENTKNRNIYIFDSDTHDLLVTNAPKTSAFDALSGLVVNDNTKSVIFSQKKNTPKAYFKLDNPNWFIIVDTTKQVTAKTITKARYRILLALSIAALSIIIMVSLYTYYLYINIRQLFKGITAISKGNYDKKIHLIKNIFTPHEVVFLSKEFNYMANKVNVSHKDLKKKNKELETLNKFREDLINSTSHEFRTPLTSIIGYTSRLLRHDIKVDEQTRIKSLQTIKEQAQRLSRMVEDLLVIPQLDTLSLKFNIQETDLSSSLARVIDYVNPDNVEIVSDISSNLNYVWADEYRLEQIILNLIDNAVKYSIDNEPVTIKAYNDGSIPVVQIKNKCAKIPSEIQEKLFEKFVRADSELTRTTRGTGLGLYIVKGLCEAMKINIMLKCDDEFVITLKFNDYVK